MNRRTEDEQAYHDYEMRQWASQKPKTSDSQDNPSSDEAKIYDDRELADWARNMPNHPTGYENERR